LGGADAGAVDAGRADGVEGTVAEPAAPPKAAAKAEPTVVPGTGSGALCIPV
jgi:hypothetical protein